MWISHHLRLLQHFEGRICLTIFQRHTKGKRDRRIPIVDKSLVKLLRGYIRGIPPEDPLFEISRRRVELLVRDLAHKAGIKKPIHPHTLRHTAATLYLKNGTNIESIRRMLGHASLSTTQKYLQLTDEEVAKDLSSANWWYLMNCKYLRSPKRNMTKSSYSMK